MSTNRIPQFSIISPQILKFNIIFYCPVSMWIKNSFRKSLECVLILQHWPWLPAAEDGGVWSQQRIHRAIHISGKSLMQSNELVNPHSSPEYRTMQKCRHYTLLSFGLGQKSGVECFFILFLNIKMALYVKVCFFHKAGSPHLCTFFMSIKCSLYLSTTGNG